MQPVTMPVLPLLRGSFAKVKAKSPGWHPRSRSRRARSIACLILIFFQNFRGKPSSSVPCRSSGVSGTSNVVVVLVVGSGFRTQVTFL